MTVAPETEDYRLVGDFYAKKTASRATCKTREKSFRNTPRPCTRSLTPYFS